LYTVINTAAILIETLNVLNVLDDQRGLAQAIMDTLREPFLVLDRDLRVVAASRSFYILFRVDPRDTIGRPVHDLGDGQCHIPALRVLLEQVITDRAVIEGFEVAHDFPRLGPRVMLLNARKVFYADGTGTTLLLAFEDVTGLRAAESERRHVVFATAELLRHKDLLIEEMRHRVANSLQIIASVLMLKARMVTSDETRTHLHDAHRRILSLAALQSQLRATAPGEQVEVEPYLQNLCGSLAASMVGDDGKVSLRVDADPGAMTAAEAVSLGLIVTELVINALKHAFPVARPDAEVLVGYTAAPPGWVLRVVDNGVGMPASGVSPAKGGLGTSLVHALAHSLEARVELASSPAGLEVSVMHATSRLALPAAA